MGNPFTSISCAIREDNARVLTWTLQPGANYPPNFTLRVENSRNGGDWEVIADGLHDVCHYVDTRRRNYNKRMNESYRIRLLTPDKTYVSDIVDAGNYKAYPFSATAENVVKQLETTMKESGTPGVLVKRKRWGSKCPLCVDFSGQQTVNEHCPRCLGTGIDGGYFPGIPLSILKDNTTTQEQTSEMGWLQGETVQGRCIAWPWVCVEDVWVEDGTNKRYRINSVTPAASYKQTTLVYTVQMHQLEYTDVLHSPEMDDKVRETGMWESDELPHRSSWDKELEVL